MIVTVIKMTAHHAMILPLMAATFFAKLCSRAISVRARSRLLTMSRDFTAALQPADNQPRYSS